ncbi:MAG: DsbA family protein, partial [Bacteroidaceae bacterium]|nr:DsbA family protein [Bacteroidaceae bacterium]
MKKLRITVFADPVCTWCWGSAPVLRALEYRLGDMVEIDYVMCGMIEDIRTFINRRLNIGGDAALSNRNMMKAWLEASVVHGMPVQEHGFHLFSDEYPSSFPQNMAYLTAKLCCRQDEHGEPDMKRVNRYLRRVQEATAAEAVMTSRADVLADLAAVEGYDPQDFAQTFASDAVKKAFIADRERARSYDVEAFPTFLLEYDGREAKLSGYT